MPGIRVADCIANCIYHSMSDAGNLQPDGQKTKFIRFYCAGSQIDGKRYHTLVLLFFLCPVTDISLTVAPISVKFCTIISVPDRSSPLSGRCPQRIPESEILGLNFGHLTTNISKLVSHSIACQLELNINQLSSTIPSRKYTQIGKWNISSVAPSTRGNVLRLVNGTSAQ